jgi:hypothetical protein
MSKILEGKEVSFGLWDAFRNPISKEPDRSWNTIEHTVFCQRTHYAQWFAAAGQPRHPNFKNADEIQNLFPDIIVEKLNREHDVSHLYWWAILPGIDPILTYESMELFANQIL